MQTNATANHAGACATINTNNHVADQYGRDKFAPSLACSPAPSCSTYNTFARISAATGMTVYLTNGGLLEHAQQMTAHESARTTTLYDRRNDQVSRHDSSTERGGIVSRSVAALAPEKPPQVVVDDYVHPNRIKMPTVGCDSSRVFCTCRRRYHRHITHCLGRI
jgi:hypothetical protein